VRISLILAADENNLIGKDGALPWHLSEDLKRFKRLTSGHVVVVGRLTHESIVDRLGHPLPDRTSIVLTRRPIPTDRPDTPSDDGVPRSDGLTRNARVAGDDGVIYHGDVPGALRLASSLAESAGQDEIFVIGGAEIYVQALAAAQRVYLTRVRGVFEGDRGLPEGWLDGFELVDEDVREDGRYAFLTYERG
jgi:dihydrofolate reductase